MKQVGIWIDKREAKVVSLENGKEHIETITSGIEEFNPTGGSGTKAKGGPQDVVQDSRYLERENHQFSAFSKEIVPAIESANSVVIFGPAQSGQRLLKEIQHNNQLSGRVLSVERADNMTDNQLKEWVRDFYKSHG